METIYGMNFPWFSHGKIIGNWLYMGNLAATEIHGNPPKNMEVFFGKEHRR